MVLIILIYVIIYGNSSKISFKEYANNLGYSKIDELYILLTWNGVGGTMREYSFNDWLFSNAKKLML